MSLKPLIAIVGFVVLATPVVSPAASAQTTTVVQPGATAATAAPYAGRRIEINPRPLLYRRCIDWYELQHRPSGTVLYPQMRCWWVRG
jgi:hypothetical protein